MKKLLAMLLSLSLLAALLSGCGGSTTSTTTTSSDDAGEESAEDTLFVPDIPTQSSDAEEASDETAAEPSYTLPISEETLTYSIWMTYAPFAADLVDTETMEGVLVLDTIQEVTNIHFDVTAVNGAAEEDNFNLMIAGGDYCDIISSMAYYSTGLEGAVEEGIIQDLADVIPEKCPIYWSYLSSNTNTLMSAYTNSGYMPTFCVVTPEVGQEVVGPVLRQDWLDEFGMDMPTTYDELYDYLEQALNEKGAIYELSSTDGMVADLAYGLNLGFNDVSNLGDFTVVDGEVQYALTQDAFKDYLTFMNKLYTNGIISQDFYSDTSEDLSSQARIDFGLGTNSLLGTAATNTSDIVSNVTDDNFEMAVMPYVSVDGTTENHVGPTTLSNTMKDDDAWAISTECDDIDPICQLVEFLYSDEGYLLTNYGVEDETYTLDENGDPQYTDLIINNPDGLSYFFASYVYATNTASGFFPYINDMSRSFYDFNDNQWQVYEDLKELSDCAYNYPSYATLSTEESSDYTALEAEITTYTDTRILEFITGAADIETEFEDFVDTLYDMGAQDLIDIKQDAYDRAMQRVEALGL